MRLIPQAQSMGELLAQSSVPASAMQSWDGSAPSWRMQSKYRNQFDRIAQEKGSLTHNWREFFASGQDSGEAQFRVGDTSRKHLTRPGATETEWKPCFKIVSPPQHAVHAFGKKAVAPPQLSRFAELTDVPQGKKHIAPPVDQLPQEMKLFQLRHKVRSAEGGLANQRMSDPEAREAPRGPKLVPMEARRNGLPQSTKGDKPYSAVELSIEYAAGQASTRPRLGLERVAGASDKKVVDQWSVKQQRINRDADVARVRGLPDIGGAAHDDD